MWKTNIIPYVKGAFIAICRNVLSDWQHKTTNHRVVQHHHKPQATNDIHYHYTTGAWCVQCMGIVIVSVKQASQLLQTTMPKTKRRRRRVQSIPSTWWQALLIHMTHLSSAQALEAMERILDKTGPADLLSTLPVRSPVQQLGAWAVQKNTHKQIPHDQSTWQASKRVTNT